MCRPFGTMDCAMAIEALGLKKFGDKGNMTKAEIDFLIDYLIPLKKAGTSAPSGRISANRST